MHYWKLRGLMSFLSDMYIKDNISVKILSSFRQTQGVLQGSVLSLALLLSNVSHLR